MFEEIKKRVFEGNLKLVEYGLVKHTWGNVSEIDRVHNVVVIKPSGVSYSKMKAEEMVVVDLCTGKVLEGKLNPSSDTPTHLEIYKAFPSIKSIVHTHSLNAVVFAQASLDIKPLGTTQADYFCGTIHCTRSLTREEVEKNYEKNTGLVIIEEIQNKNIDVNSIPAILVSNHGPFVFGKSVEESVFNASVLEIIAEMNLKTLLLNPQAVLPKYILDKHYNRKHGINSYYGQKGK